MQLLVLVVVLSGLSADAAAQPSGAAEGPQSGDALSRLVTELEARNPLLAAAAREIDQRAARVAPAGAPPDPVLSVGYMSGFLRPPFFPSASTPDAFRQVAISQEVPYPGTLGLRARVAAADVDVAKWSYEDTRLRLIADLKVSYAEYLLVSRTAAIVERNKRALEQVRGVAEARFSVAKATQQDVLRAQLEISILLERMALLERDRTVLAAEINRLLNRPADTLIPVGEINETAPADADLDTSAGRALQAPALRRDDAELTRVQQAYTLTRREQRPDFGIRFTTQKYVGGMPWMYGLDVMVTLPVFWGRKQRPLVTEATAAVEAATATREATRTDISARIAQERATLATSRRLLDLYGDSVVPQARLALESAIASYEVGAVDFLTLLTNFVAVLNYEIGQEEQRARYRQALARLEPLTGVVYLR